MGSSNAGNSASLRRSVQNMNRYFRFKARKASGTLMRRGRKSAELLILSSPGNSHGISYPFEVYGKRLFDEIGLAVLEVESDSLAEKQRALQRFEGDVALIAPPQKGADGKMMPREEIKDFFCRLHPREGQKRVLLDVSDSPTGRHFECAPYVDMYAMSFTYTDLEDYRRDFIVGNKFADFASTYYGLEPTVENHFWPGLFDSRIDAEQISKIFTIHRIGSRRRMHKYYRDQGSRCLWGGERNIDVHCRFNAYAGWCRAHRYHVKDVLTSLSGKYKIIASEEKIPVEQYHAELNASTMLFSPFGWGEFCPKDWEAFLKGCLLLKPSVEHVKTFPHMLIPYETYVPVKWDLSDVEEKVAYYLEHVEERDRIIANAARVVNDFYEGSGFINLMKEMMVTLGCDL